MNPIARKLLSRALDAFTSAPLRDARRWLAERRRRVRGEPHRVLYLHQVDDPYSHLAAQLLDELVARYDVALEPQLVGPPPDAAAPERERLQAFARKDAADVAPGYGLDWGVDRLHHLERRLASLGARRSGSDATPIAPRPDYRELPAPRASERLTLEFYPSLRSPYSYIALERVFALPQRYPLELRLRPVLPMVMRGLPVPRRNSPPAWRASSRSAEAAC